MLTLPQNKGAATARNAGLAIAKGQYIQFLDADDLLSPDKIERQLKALNNSITQLAICKTVYFNNGDDYKQVTPLYSWYDTDVDDTVDFLVKLYAGEDVMPGYGGMVTVHAWLTPAEVIKKAGPWKEELSVDDDGEFFREWYWHQTVYAIATGHYAITASLPTIAHYQANGRLKQ
ncbi:glycosyltransferase family 2 protein [Mucilaginibacter antarcticus]|uniref:glycosyltransferase family 2 protein n=1 Tax=Mucilaginibacter antarcticus TaxID=1855725 RepID=UPI00364087EB